MPIYEYQCKKGHITEELFDVNDVPRIMPCKGCNNNYSAQRIMSTFHFDFKNVPRLIDKKRNKELALKREQLAEQNERGY